MFPENQRFRTKYVSKSDPGPKKVPRGWILGAKMRPKRHQKRDKNDINILIDLGMDFGAILEDQMGTSHLPHGELAECAGPG